uniref:Uncharacterized protein n=1 Tax=Glossina pallidipes TaxID=7398 RepID=A0A1A9ZGN9_GLOPL
MRSFIYFHLQESRCRRLCGCISFDHPPYPTLCLTSFKLLRYAGHSLVHIGIITLFYLSLLTYSQLTIMTHSANRDTDVDTVSRDRRHTIAITSSHLAAKEIYTNKISIQV